MGIYNMDVREQNYRGGRLFDFSNAITTPHMSFYTKLRSEEEIFEDMDDDLERLNEIQKRVTKEREADQIAQVGRWNCLRSRSS